MKNQETEVEESRIFLETFSSLQLLRPSARSRLSPSQIHLQPLHHLPRDHSLLLLRASPAFFFFLFPFLPIRLEILFPLPNWTLDYTANLRTSLWESLRVELGQQAEKGEKKGGGKRKVDGGKKKGRVRRTGTEKRLKEERSRVNHPLNRQPS